MRPMTYTVLLNGESLRLEVTECVIHAEGEFAYNLDCTLQPSRSMNPKDALHLFEVQPPGSEERLSAIGSGRRGDAVSLTFHLKGYVDDPASVKQVEVFWDGDLLGVVPCELEEAESPVQPLAQSRQLVKKDRPVALYLGLLALLLAAGVAYFSGFAIPW